MSKTYAANVRDNVAHAMGRPADDVEVERAARAVFRASMRNFADLMVVPRLSEADFIRQVPVVEGSWDEVDAAQAEGRGVMFVSGHLGSFDYVGQLINTRGFPLHIVTGRTTSRFLFDAVTYLRRSRGIHMWEPTPSGVRRVIQALRRGECAVLVADHDFFQNGRPVRFFGHETTLPPGAIRIARDSGVILVPIFGIRFADGFGVRILPAIRVPKTASMDADLAEGFRQVIAVLERVIGLTPEQWVMFQRVWPSAPVDPVRVFPVGSPFETDIVERIGASIPRRRPTE